MKKLYKNHQIELFQIIVLTIAQDASNTLFKFFAAVVLLQVLNGKD